MTAVAIQRGYGTLSTRIATRDPLSHRFSFTEEARKLVEEYPYHSGIARTYASPLGVTIDYRDWQEKAKATAAFVKQEAVADPTTQEARLKALGFHKLLDAELQRMKDQEATIDAHADLKARMALVEQRKLVKMTTDDLSLLDRLFPMRYSTASRGIPFSQANSNALRFGSVFDLFQTQSGSGVVTFHPSRVDVSLSVISGPPLISDRVRVFPHPDHFLTSNTVNIPSTFSTGRDVTVGYQVKVDPKTGRRVGNVDEWDNTVYLYGRPLDRYAFHEGIPDQVLDLIEVWREVFHEMYICTPEPTWRAFRSSELPQAPVYDPVLIGRLDDSAINPPNQGLAELYRSGIHYFLASWSKFGTDIHEPASMKPDQNPPGAAMPQSDAPGSWRGWNPFRW